MNISDIRAGLRTLVENEETTFKQIALESGLSTGTISSFINDKYNGDNERVSQMLQRWLEKYHAVAELPEPPRFVETQTVKQIWTSMRFASLTESIAVVCGNPGVGKTEAAREYRRTNNNVWMITITPSCASVLECLTELAFELGMNDAPRRKGPLSRALRRRLEGTQGLVIIDEADHLGAEVLEELRLLQESTRIGLVLMGNHRVYSNMTGGNRTVEFARLFSRIAKRTAINKTKKADVKAIADAWQINGEKELELLQQIAQKPGALRILNHSLRLAAMTAHGKGERVNEDYLRQAFRELDLDVDISTLLRN
ncbi:AAA family ATPase [Escherichia coli]|jgi:DNA transposition AAA+ family ATPase|uniref:ATP-dependent target DNA activator B n=8 Tax=root TaxID=1 RepID=TARGB_BPMU|nr:MULTISPECIES: AAA family ATPase [Enterobacteriaceae]NP_050608.1 DNA transposition protein [Escherichia phage Mu]P03763.1 RecName: Full=ATP-dependent target DNA activator B; AltName: Full=Gene product 04; Short=gp04; AltName: Full=Gene product B; Short=gpB; AltName: Full=MuB [Escherichia phage Mu]AAW58941.1 B protein [Cloning vector MuNXKan]AKN19588.1 MuB [Cloning vector pVK9PtacMuAB]ATO98416.1 mu phage transposase subunit B [Cloning vector pVK-lacIQ-Ptac-MuAB]EAO8666413.1 DNA transposition